MSAPELRRRLPANFEQFWRVADERERIEDGYWLFKRDERIPWRGVRAEMKMPLPPAYLRFPRNVET